LGRGALRARRGRPRKAAATKTLARNVTIGSIHRIGERINRKVKAGDRNLELYQIGTDAAEGEGEEFGGEFAAEGVTAKAECGEECGAAAGEGVED